MKLSVVIPSYKDQLLVNTINSLLDNSELKGEIEIIAVLDGYWPEFQLPNHPQVNYIHLGRNRGMREAINTGIRLSRGEFIMRSDEHCMFTKGFDAELTKVCQPNWIMTMRRYFLDPVKWQVMDLPPVDYEKLKICHTNDQGGRKFTGVTWDRPDRHQIAIDESMAMQGSCWLMPRQWWNDVIGELQTEGYGPHYQDSHEMIFKTWKAGGKFMVDKRVWFAHKHRSFPRTHNGTKENPINAEAGWAYSLSQWEDYYNQEVKPKWGI